MADTRHRRSPLHDLAERFAAASHLGDRIRLTEVPFLTQLTLHLGAGTPAAQILGVTLPTVPNTTTSVGNDVQVLWMGPNEWLLLAPDGAAECLRERLEHALEGHHASVVDVSAQRTVIEVAGADARDVLGKGCSLDLHPRSFPVGRCAQSTLAQAQVVLLPRSQEPAYWVFVRASFAEYLAEWLLDAAAEYRGAPPLDLSLDTDQQLVGAPA